MRPYFFGPIPETNIIPDAIRQVGIGSHIAEIVEKSAKRAFLTPACCV
jgi:hypothetical protein